MRDAAKPSGEDRDAQTGDVPDPLDLGPVITERRREYALGTRRMNQAGYITVKCGTMESPLWESEGRLVLERHLGRRLRDDEEVRHIPGVATWDNRLEGIELWRRGRPVKLQLPRRPPAKRTNWKRLYADAIAALEDLQPQLHGDQAAAVQRVLDDRP